jgi:nickel-dependent lactate racemase
MVQKIQIQIPYGPEDSISLSLPESNFIESLEPAEAPRDLDCTQEIERALSAPLQSKPLYELVKNKSSVVIVADDNTRLTPTGVILPLVLNLMNDGGIADDQIKLIIALGTHRPMTDDEIARKFGQETFNRIEIINHDFRDPKVLVDLGVTDLGTPISINKHVIEAEFVLGIGSVYPHHIPGFAGGAKIIQPGVSGGNTTGHTHLAGCRMRPTLLGQLENPVRTEMEIVAERSGLTHILNTVLSKDGTCIHAFFGDMRTAFRTAAEYSQKVHGVEFENQADIVVASSHPMDIEFWQAHKALYPADLVGKPGGTIILATPCPEGVSRTHGDMTTYAGGTPEEIEAGITNGTITDLTAAALAIAWANVRLNKQVNIVSDGLSSSEITNLGCVPYEDVPSALEAAFERHGPNAKVTILPFAPETLPIKV